MVEQTRPSPASRWHRPALALAALLVSSAGLAGATSAAAAPAAAPTARPKAPVTTTYENPLAPDVPGDGTVDSCADPMVIQGQDGERIDGEQVWYLYCTTDPLNDEDVDANGDPVFHRIPTSVSTDLVNWTYVGDAFPRDGGDLPAWIDPTAAFWAPEVVYSSTTDRYYLFTTVTETTAAGGGSDTCRGDGAIGVAVSDTATGPWEWCGRAGGRAAQGPGRRRVLVLLDLRPGRPRRHGHRRGPAVLRLLLRRALRHPDRRDRGRRDRPHGHLRRRHPHRHRQPLRGRERRVPGRLLLPLRLRHELLQRRPHRLQRLRRALHQPARPVPRQGGQLLPRRPTSAGRRS